MASLHPRQPPLRGTSEIKTYNPDFWNVLVIGGSRDVGFPTALAFLERAFTVTFLLRDKHVFDEDGTVQAFISAGALKLVEGSAFTEADVKKAWDAAMKHGAGPQRGIDVLTFTVAGSPKYAFSKAEASPPNVVTLAVQALLCGTRIASTPATRLILVTGAGALHESLSALPWSLRQLTLTTKAASNRDKLAAERLIAHAAGWTWDAVKHGVPEEERMMEGGKGWASRSGMPAEGSLTNLLVVRPLPLTDGECQGDKTKDERHGKDPYKVETLNVNNEWSISKKDVAHFIVKAATSKWEQYKNSAVYLGY
ncbi:hypothetical protein BDV98DRAFT_569269 [Pterulicium gracile]|uniref:NAD(P)-binding domain-containing protein n=1 Tax=Pterulicium gracile TaxID=1884261 RepID=A0A5C3QEV6_9AGAR|nr:hypothetical protein BDV98DRAFT_569269 [Pterula gracilis]